MDEKEEEGAVAQKKGERRGYTSAEEGIFVMACGVARGRRGTDRLCSDGE